jgi:hypothetical protein
MGVSQPDDLSQPAQQGPPDPPDFGLYSSGAGQRNRLTCGKTGQAIVEVAGIEPASSGFSVGLLRAQPVLDCRDHHRYRRQRWSVSDLSVPGDQSAQPLR